MPDTGAYGHPTDRIVLVLQGGGALGAYQAGVYQALHQAGLEPHWVIGTSIGAFNGALIAGNEPADRVARLRDFWGRIVVDGPGRWPAPPGRLTELDIIARGVPNFFAPNLPAFWDPDAPLGPEAAAYYSTRPLRRTLSGLIQRSLLGSGQPRLTVGAANVGTIQMKYFDSRDMPLTEDHVVASGALPPGFPAVRIGPDLFWDGGVLSNTPLEVVFDDHPRRSALVFVVDLWAAGTGEPSTISEVIARQKEAMFASRADSVIARQQQLHRLRHIIDELTRRLPPDQREDAGVKAMSAYGCTTRMHIVRLLAPMRTPGDPFRDIDFTRAGIASRWEAGLSDTGRVLARAPWNDPGDALDGFVLHQCEHDLPVAGP